MTFSTAMDWLTFTACLTAGGFVYLISLFWPTSQTSAKKEEYDE